MSRLDHPKRRWPSKNQRLAAKLAHRHRCSGQHTVTGACIVGLGRKKLTRQNLAEWSDQKVINVQANITLAERHHRPTGWSEVDRLAISREVSFRGLAYEVIRRVIIKEVSS